MDEDAAHEIAVSLKKLMTAQRFGDDVFVEVIILEHLVLDPYTVDEEKHLDARLTQGKSLYADSLELSAEDKAENGRVPTGRATSKTQVLAEDRRKHSVKVGGRAGAALADFDYIVQKIVHDHTDEVAIQRQHSAAGSSVADGQPDARKTQSYIHGHKHVDCDVHHRMKDKFAEEHGLQYDTVHINN